MVQGSIVLGIDLLPIKPIKNVKTLVSDITTAECRKLVTQELHGWKADVVLCDGAPNVGSAYTKDAYVQNELALAALKTATDHLVEGGTFCTKVYRSKDYNSLMWVFQQLFTDVQAIKPNSSRSQSAEIFIVCLHYTAPKVIDPKLLDPNHVFKEVAMGSVKVLDVLHKKFDKHDKRQRGGYDDNANLLLTRSQTVSAFIESSDPVRLLTDISSLKFSATCEELYGGLDVTTEEIKICLDDLKVLGRLDFKKLLKWRMQVRKELGMEDSSKVVDAPALDVALKAPKRDKSQPLTEEEIQQEIAAKRQRLEEDKRKQKKKQRELSAKERRRQALGINSDSFGVGEDMELFHISGDQVSSRSDLEGVDDVDLEELEAGFDDDDELVQERRTAAMITMEGDELENELDLAYKRYVSKTRGQSDHKIDEEVAIRDGDYERGYEKKARMAAAPNAVLTKSAKEQRQQLQDDLEGYVKLLAGEEGGDAERSDSDSDSESDKSEESASGDVGSDVDEHEEEQEQVVTKKAKRGKSSAELVTTQDRVPKETRVSQWFSHPIFKETVVQESNVASKDNSGVNDAAAPTAGKKRPRKGEVAVDEDDIEKRFPDLVMPLSDKQKRREKRKKEDDKKQRKEEKQRSKEEKEGEFTLGFEIAPVKKDNKVLDEQGNLVDAETLRLRELIRNGMGKGAPLRGPQDVDDNAAIEIAPKESSVMDGFGPMSSLDSRTYDSDSEDYDKRDKTMTLALGTMMLRKSRKKAFVDASYNRFAWNDPKDLPQWFLDDEMKHNRPQLPIPQPLLDQVGRVVVKDGCINSAYIEILDDIMEKANGPLVMDDFTM